MSADARNDMPTVSAMVASDQGDDGNETIVEIELAGLEASGKVMAQVYDSAEAMKARKGAVLRFAVDAGGSPRVRTMVPMQPGRYAIALFQDTKGTGKMESRMGVPTVPYGFSNDARGTFGPPAFDEAAFVVPDAPVKLSITLR